MADEFSVARRRGWVLNRRAFAGHAFQDQQRRPNGLGFAFGELLGKAPQVTKGACSRFGPTSSGSLTPTTLRGPAPNGHPCPDGALAASMRLGPLRVVYDRPAPKSRLAVSGPSAHEDQQQIKSRSRADQEQIKSFPAEAGPTDCTRCFLVGPALAGKRPVQALEDFRPERYLWERACSRMRYLKHPRSCSPTPNLNTVASPPSTPVCISAFAVHRPAGECRTLETGH